MRGGGKRGDERKRGGEALRWLDCIKMDSKKAEVENQEWSRAAQYRE